MRIIWVVSGSFLRLFDGVQHINNSRSKLLELFFLNEVPFLSVFYVVELIEELEGFFFGGRSEFCFHGDVLEDLVDRQILGRSGLC